MSFEQKQARARYISFGTLTFCCLLGVAVWGKYSGLILHRFWGQSDLRYTVETRIASEGDRVPMPMSRVTYYYTRGARRVETEYTTTPALPGLTVITRCPEQTSYTINESRGIYYKEKFSLGAERGTDDELPPVFGQATPSPRRATQPKIARVDINCCGQSPVPVQLAQLADGAKMNVGIIKRRYNVEQLGRDTIADVKTVHYRLTASVKKTGCAGNVDINQKMEIWVAPSLWAEFACARPTPTPTPQLERKDDQSRRSTPPQPPPNPLPTPHPAPTSSYSPTPTPQPKPTPQPESECAVDETQEGNAGDFAGAFHGLVMHMKIYEGERVVFEQEVTQLSQKQLFADQFRVDDYKLVSREEFQRQTMEAMMKQMNAAKATPSMQPPSTASSPSIP